MVQLFFFLRSTNIFEKAASRSRILTFLKKFFYFLNRGFLRFSSLQILIFKTKKNDKNFFYFLTQVKTLFAFYNFLLLRVLKRLSFLNVNAPYKNIVVMLLMFIYCFFVDEITINRKSNPSMTKPMIILTKICHKNLLYTLILLKNKNQGSINLSLMNYHSSLSPAEWLFSLVTVNNYSLNRLIMTFFYFQL